MSGYLQKLTLKFNKLRSIIITCCLCVILSLSTGLYAKTWDVNNTKSNASDTGSLAYAIANAVAGDIIKINANTRGIIDVSSPFNVTQNNLTIEGNFTRSFGTSSKAHVLIRMQNQTGKDAIFNVTGDNITFKNLNLLTKSTLGSGVIKVAGNNFKFEQSIIKDATDGSANSALHLTSASFGTDIKYVTFIEFNCGITNLSGKSVKVNNSTFANCGNMHCTTGQNTGHLLPNSPAPAYSENGFHGDSKLIGQEEINLRANNHLLLAQTTPGIEGTGNTVSSNTAPSFSLKAGDRDVFNSAKTGTKITYNGTINVEDTTLGDSVKVGLLTVSVAGTTTNSINTNALSFMKLSPSGATSDIQVIDNQSKEGKLNWYFDSGSETFSHLSGQQSISLTYTVLAIDQQSAVSYKEITVSITSPLIVSNSSDYYPGDSAIPNTLRWAIEEANKNADLTAIQITATGTLNLQAKLPVVNYPVIINGNYSAGKDENQFLKINANANTDPSDPYYFEYTLDGGCDQIDYGDLCGCKNNQDVCEPCEYCESSGENSSSCDSDCTREDYDVLSIGKAANGSNISGLYFTNAYIDVLEILADKVNLTNSYFEGYDFSQGEYKDNYNLRYWGDGIDLQGNNHIVRNNKLKGFLDQAIDATYKPTGTTTALDISEDTMIADNEINQNLSAYDAAQGTEEPEGIQASANNLILNNKIYDTHTGIEQEDFFSVYSKNSIYNLKSKAIDQPDLPIPDISNAVLSNGDTTLLVTGSFAGTANKDYRIEIFGHDNSDGTKKEARYYLGSTDLRSGGGNFNFNFQYSVSNFSTTYPGKTFSPTVKGITVTATNLDDKKSSEVSIGKALSVSTDLEVRNLNADGQYSLKWAIDEANKDASLKTITFNLDSGQNPNGTILSNNTYTIDKPVRITGSFDPDNPTNNHIKIKNNTPNSPLFIINSKDVTLENLKLIDSKTTSANLININNENITIRNSHLEGAGRSAITLGSAATAGNDITIENNTFKNIAKNAVEGAKNTSNVIIKNNTIFNAAKSSSPSNIALNAFDGWSVTNNNINNFYTGIKQNAVTGSNSNAYYTTNLIYNFTNKAIDLGITNNDDKDPDTGVNTKLNHPIITEAKKVGALTSIKGFLNSEEDSYYIVQLFADDQSTPAGAKQFLGEFEINIPTGSNQVEFSMVYNETATDKPAVLPYITATATKISGQGGTALYTSELSRAGVSGVTLAQMTVITEDVGRGEECGNNDPNPKCSAEFICEDHDNNASTPNICTTKPGVVDPGCTDTSTEDFCSNGASCNGTSGVCEIPLGSTLNCNADIACKPPAICDDPTPSDTANNDGLCKLPAGELSNSCSTSGSNSDCVTGAECGSNLEGSNRCVMGIGEVSRTCLNATNSTDTGASLGCSAELACDKANGSKCMYRPGSLDPGCPTNTNPTPSQSSQCITGTECEGSSGRCKQKLIEGGSDCSSTNEVFCDPSLLACEGTTTKLCKYKVGVDNPKCLTTDTSDDHCSTTSSCNNGKCKYQLSNAQDNCSNSDQYFCNPTSLICESGLCKITLGNIAPSCSSNNNKDDCVTGSVCDPNDNKCKTLITTPLLDCSSATVFCEPDRLVCYTDNTVTPTTSKCYLTADQASARCAANSSDDAECHPNLSCLGDKCDGCTQTCTNGTTCKAGVCRIEVTTAGDSCKDDPANDKYYFCTEETLKCQDNSSGGQTCKKRAGKTCPSNPALCENGAICESNLCKIDIGNPADSCSNLANPQATDCVAGAECDGNLCETAAGSVDHGEYATSCDVSKTDPITSRDCKRDLICEDTKCIGGPGYTGGSCTNSKNCAAGLACVTRNSTDVCVVQEGGQDCNTNPAICPPPNQCQGTKCSIVIDPTEDCTGKELECPLGTECVLTSSGTSKFCNTTSGPTCSDTTNSSDCPENTLCVNVDGSNVCQVQQGSSCSSSTPDSCPVGTTCMCPDGTTTLSSCSGSSICKSDSGSSCASNKECPVNTECINNTCKVIADASCAGGQVECPANTSCQCPDGSTTCSAANKVCLPASGGSCTVGGVDKNELCPTATICVSGICKSDNGTECITSSSGDKICPLGTSCNSDNKCVTESGLKCPNGDNDCPVGSLCDNKGTTTKTDDICVVQPGTSCLATGADICPVGTTCQADKCVATSGLDCSPPNSDICPQSTTCNPTTNTCQVTQGQVCTTATANLCPIGTICQDDVCRIISGSKCPNGNGDCPIDSICYDNGTAGNTVDDYCQVQQTADCPSSNNNECPIGTQCINKKCIVSSGSACKDASNNDDNSLCPVNTLCVDGYCEVIKGVSCETDVNICPNGTTCSCASSTTTTSTTCATGDSKVCKIDTGSPCPNGDQDCPVDSSCLTVDGTKVCVIDNATDCPNGQLDCPLGTTCSGSPDNKCLVTSGTLCPNGNVDCPISAICDNKGTSVKTDDSCVVQPGTACTGTSPNTCPLGTLCEANKCVAYSGLDCTASANICPKSTVCNPLTKTCIVEQGQPCTANNGLCPVSTECLNGVCQIKSGTACTDAANSSDCPDNTLCVSVAGNNICQVQQTATCPNNNDKECPIGTLCISQKCVINSGSTCTDTTDCPVNTTCKSGFCEVNHGVSCGNGTGSTTSLACPYGTDCTCPDQYSTCTNDLKICKSTSGIQCTNDNGCPEFTKCKDGSCEVGNATPCPAGAADCPIGTTCSTDKLCLLTSGSSCQNISDCPLNSLCTDNICVVQPGIDCASASNICPVGTTCDSSSKECISQSTTDCTGVFSNICPESTECVSVGGNKICVVQPGQNCTTNPELCPLGTICSSDKVCIAQSGLPCTSTPNGQIDCPQDTLCIDGVNGSKVCQVQERQPCNNDSELCPKGTTCISEDNVCHVISGSSCANTDDCPITSECVSGSCRVNQTRSCSATSECPIGTSCESGLCKVDSGSSCPNGSDSECPVNSKCINNFCRVGHGVTSSTGQNGCPVGTRYNATTNICQVISGKTCSDATNHSDCPVDTLCTDGICVVQPGTVCGTTNQGICPVGTTCDTSDNKCKVLSGEDCSSNNNICPVSSRCLDGACRVVNGFGCDNNQNLCPKGTICGIDKVCMAITGGTCSGGNDKLCPKGTKCLNDICTTYSGSICPAGGKADCPIDANCIDGICRVVSGASCSNDAQCAQGTTCYQNVCTVIGGLACTETPSCPYSTNCLDGACKGILGTYCQNDPHCLTNICDNKVANVCTDKYPPQSCNNTSECSDDLACIDGICVACQTTGQCQNNTKVCYFERCRNVSLINDINPATGRGDDPKRAVNCSDKYRFDVSQFKVSDTCSLVGVSLSEINYNLQVFCMENHTATCKQCLGYSSSKEFCELAQCLYRGIEQASGGRLEYKAKCDTSSANAIMKAAKYLYKTNDFSICGDGKVQFPEQCDQPKTGGAGCDMGCMPMPDWTCDPTNNSCSK